MVLRDRFSLREEQGSVTGDLIPAYVLAGGSSRRFGMDKARVQISGNTQLERLVDQLCRCGHAVSVVADRRDRYADLGIECIADPVAAAGPLAGLVAALGDRKQRLGGGWLLLVGCDQAWWKQDWSEQFVRAVEKTSASPSSREPLAITFLPADEDRTSATGSAMQPIPGLYHSNLLPTASQHLEQRRLSLRSLLQNANYQSVSIQDHPREYSFNSRQELANLLSRLDD